MTIYDDALDAKAAVAVVKLGLPVSFVLAYAGLQPEQVGARVRAICPFHEDHDPSLEVWLEDDRTQRWGCWPCGKRGDVIDLIRWIWGGTFTEAVEAGRRLMKSMGAWAGPAPAVGSTWDAAGASKLMLDAFKAFDSSAVKGLIDLKGWRFGPSTLRDWMCGTQHGRLVVPFFSEQGKLVAVKHRSLAGDDKMISLPGSQLRSVLYGENRPHDRTLLICEGESDTWTASSVVGSQITALGLPSGAGTPPHPYIERLAGLRVYLAFDGDSAGDEGANRWAAALAPRSEVIRLELPRGYDVTSVGSVDWLQALY